MAKEHTIEIPVIHTYDKTLDINVCKVQVSPAFRELLELFVVTTGRVGYTTTLCTVEGNRQAVAKERYMIKTVLFSQSDIHNLSKKELFLGAFYDTESWDNMKDVIFYISSLKDYYELSDELKLFFQGILNAVAAVKINIVHTYIAKIREE